MKTAARGGVRIARWTPFSTGCYVGSGGGGFGAQVQPGCSLAADACTFRGGTGDTTTLNNVVLPGWGGHGLSVSGNATLAHSSCYGGYGAGPAGAQGGRGVSVPFTGAFLRVCGTAADVIAGADGAQPGEAIWAASPAVVHGAVSLSAGYVTTPVTSGPVTLGAPALPYLSMSGTIVDTGKAELQAVHAVTLAADGLLPLAPFILAVDFAPDFSTALAPFTLGELLLPFPPPIAFESTLDASGMFTMTFTPAVDAAWLCDVPLYAQFGVADSAAGNYRMSNCMIQLFRN